MTARSSAAEDYWRAACLLSFSHAAGLDWPPPGVPRRRRVVGHWGCNPGIAWAAGHLAEASEAEFLLILGTGHATSYQFAQHSLRSAPGPDLIRAANEGYGQAGGEPTEQLGVPNVPYLGGELGPALGVGQAIAACSPGRRVVTVIGDGESETPVALAAFAHHEVLAPAPGAVFLPVVNANGARMGSAARFSPKQLRGVLEGMGYTVVSSGPVAEEAAAAALRAWALAEAGVPVVWLTVSEKGWPAPEWFGMRPFRGHHAHKPGGLDLADPDTAAELGEWLGSLNDPPVVGTDGTIAPAVRRLAGRIRVDLPATAQRRPPAPARRRATGTTGSLPSRSPMAAVDQVLARRAVRVFSPDEGLSNRIGECLAAGLVTEVLAEELCSAWTWGHVEGGTPAALVSYEAFAGLVSTQLAQYLKLIGTRPAAGRPPFTVVLTSLGWANSPTHQNTDLIGGLLARVDHCPVRVVFPVGAASAFLRLNDILADHDILGVITCSKQPLLDLPDPGGSALSIRLAGGTGDGAAGDDAVIIAVGDVAVTEAVAAMALAAGHGRRIRVVALVEPGRLDWRPGSAVRRVCRPELPAVCVSWIAAHHLSAVYWGVRPAPTAQLGYRERWGPTAWETLAANGLTRWSLLGGLRAAGCALPPELDRPPGAAPGALDLSTLACEVSAL